MIRLIKGRPGGWTALVLALVGWVADPHPVRGQAATPIYYFTTLAGAASIGSADGPGTDARFNNPSGLALDSTGNLYIADAGNYSVRKLTPEGIVSTVAGKSTNPHPTDGPVSLAGFGRVTDLAVDRLGTIFVTDAFSVRRISTEGNVTTFAGYAGTGSSDLVILDGVANAARFAHPVGLAIDAGGTLFVSDANAIRRISPAAVVSTLAGSAVVGAADGTGAAAGFNSPAGLAVDAGGSVYVADSVNHLIRKILNGGVVTTLAGSPGVAGATDGVGAAARFNLPGAVSVDLLGNVFVADSYNQCIRMVTPSGQVTTLAGQPTIDPDYPMARGIIGATDGVGRAATFNNPAALVVEPSGNLYVADSGNNTIRKVTPAGVVTTIAGLPPSKSAGAVDGVGPAARFFWPRGIAVTPNGTCYVADTDNHVIRKITPAGAVSTFAGAAGQSGYTDGAGALARFNRPSDLALDAAGYIYVIDASAAVRKITPDGIVSTLAGTGAGPNYPVDGQGSAAVFWGLTAIAIDPAGNVWVGEPSGWAAGYTNHWWARLRKITPSGVVTTENVLASVVQPHTYFSGLAFGPDGTLYACDPIHESLDRVTPGGVEERIFWGSIGIAPERVTVTPAGQVVFTCHEYNDTVVAMLTVENWVALLAGRSYVNGHQEGLGYTDALFDGAVGIATDAAGSLYVACTDNTIRKGILAAAPVILTPPQNQTVAVGASVQFTVTAAAVPEPTYQWLWNGAPIAGATGSSYVLTAAQSLAGAYSVVVTNPLASVTSTSATLTVTAPAPLPTSRSRGGGGGAPSVWFLLSWCALAAGRWAAGLGRLRAG